MTPKSYRELGQVVTRSHEFSFIYICSYIYLQQIDAMAPNYLTEEYSAATQYQKDDGFKTGMCRVRLQIAPFHEDQPGLRVFYSYKNEVRNWILWKRRQTND